ncbi:MAG: cytochrome c-type biogenesis protein, partial [Pseudomonadota bacterium]
MRRKAGRKGAPGVMLALVLALCLPVAAYAQAEEPGAAPHASRLTPQDEERYQALVNELRCLVCQNQAIADSNAPLAADLREEVRAQILAGRSDAEINEYVTARYGDFVLYRPPFKPTTWLLWLGPFLLLAAGIAIAWGFAHRRRRAPAPAAPDR